MSLSSNILRGLWTRQVGICRVLQSLIRMLIVSLIVMGLRRNLLIKDLRREAPIMDSPKKVMRKNFPPKKIKKTPLNSGNNKNAGKENNKNN